MVNFKKLSARAQKAKDAIDQQGGSDALKDKAERMKGIAKGSGSASMRCTIARRFLQRDCDASALAMRVCSSTRPRRSARCAVA